MLLDINKIKDDIIKKLIDDLTSSAASDEQKKIMQLELQSKIRNNILITEIPDGEIEIKAENINKIINSLYVDLLSTYGVLNNMSEELTKYNIGYTTYINYINTRIDEINDKLESCRHSLSSIYMPSFYTEKFRTTDKFDTSRNLQKDRFDAWLPSSCYCHFEPNEHYITLPLLRQDNSLRYDDKVSTAYIEPRFQLGAGFINLKSNETDIENCIDESESSAWSETILSDAPLRVSFNNAKPNKLYINDNYFYGINNGAVTDLEINFESVNTVNEIILNPFTKYPIKIVAIRYKQTDDEDEELKELVTPDNANKLLRSKFTRTQVSFKFKEIICKKIYILFVQEHYLRKTYVYNPIEVYKNNMWFNSKNEKREKTKKAEFQPIYLDRKDNSALWKNINDKVISTSNHDLSDIIIGCKSGNRKVIKYEYEYGFYNIGCMNNHFDRTGIYVSKLINPKTNIKRVKITTDELHPIDSLNHNITDIEYYISGAENPDYKNWSPILPTGVKTIQSELIMITGGTRAYLRFQTKNIHCVMKNGEPIPYTSSDDDKKNILSNEVSFDKDNRTGNYFCIRIFNYDYDAVYSVKYDPISRSDELDLSNKITTSIEEFTGDNKNSFILSNNPYVDKTTNYCNITLSDVSSKTKGTEVDVENVTNIINQNMGYKNFTKENKYQFYVYKNRIYFNKPIPKDFIISISYRHLISKIRLKAIFRRNSTKDGWLTPILNQIKYDIQTF